MISSSNSRFFRMSALATAIAMAFLGHDVTAAPPVTNCNDNGTGSLRAAVAGAITGDIIQLPNNCTQITLASGAIQVTVNDLTLNGPGATALEIRQGLGQLDRVFNHVGSGTFSITGLSISNGIVNVTSGDAKGGCINSSGNAHLIDSVVSGCFAVANTGANYALGGGAYAAGELSLLRSTVSGNTTLAVTSGKHSYGGGVFAGNGLVTESSTLSNNQSKPDTSSYSVGGGAYIANGTATISNSTISGNQVGFGGGGIYIKGGSGVTITNSTISGNRSSQYAGGIISFSNLTLSNSTIAFNISDQAQTSNQLRAAGVDIYGATLTLNSTIIGNNRSAGAPSDVSDRINLTVMRTTPFAGSKNLIVARNLGLQVPALTLGDCPKLQRLANHGGSTQTLALRTSSPAINTGIDSNPPLVFDQRGMGFTRTFNAVDIGAYERQQGEQDDALFFSGFESGCDE